MIGLDKNIRAAKTIFRKRRQESDYEAEIEYERWF